MKRSLLIVLLLALSISCFAHISKKKRAKMDAWMHHSKHELIMSWGPPVRTASDGADGEILIYCSVGSINGDALYYYRMFYVNASGELYRWMVSKERVPPQQLNLNISRY